MFNVIVTFDLEKSTWVRDDKSPIDDLKWPMENNFFPKYNDKLQVVVGRSVPEQTIIIS